MPTDPALDTPWDEPANDVDPDALRREAARLKAMAARLLKMAEREETATGVDRRAQARENVRLRLSRAGRLDD